PSSLISLSLSLSLSRENPSLLSLFLYQSKICSSWPSFSSFSLRHRLILSKEVRRDHILAACKDSVASLFTFDLTSQCTLNGRFKKLLVCHCCLTTCLQMFIYINVLQINHNNNTRKIFEVEGTEIHQSLLDDVFPLTPIQ
ncbi:hypothetical protein F2P56_020720, partial [Juglans regia]